MVLTGFLPSSAPGGRGGRVGIVISDGAVGHTLVVVADPTRRDLVEPMLDMISSLPQMRIEGRKPTIGIVRLGRNLCHFLLRRTMRCLIRRINF